MIDDSELFHGTYDPQKAREYYLRTRKLKGKRPTTADIAKPGRGGRRPSTAVVRPAGKASRSDTKSRQAELKAQKAALEKRLDRLMTVLREKVDAAKKRGAATGHHKPDHKADSKSKDKAPETQADKADRNKDAKDRKPLTASQKSKKAKQAKEAYEKEHPTSLSDDIEILELQIKDIRSKIQKVVEDSRRNKPKAGVTAELVRPQNQSTSGPRGR